MANCDRLRTSASHHVADLQGHNPLGIKSLIQTLLHIYMPKATAKILTKSNDVRRTGSLN